MRRISHRRLVLWLIAVCVAATALACAGLGGSSTFPTGQEAPNFGVQVTGKTKTLEDYRGQVVIVNFWSST